ncbi:MAG: anaerobic ribonucleoside-triphosphate reductase [Clostridia bacterium]|nr:anaerobic ribonucleoside-triphosphate reductase [Clostridia bacterium]
MKLDGDEVELTYYLTGEPFERVRRITGYLVGTLDHWNNAKQAEERDRVKHDVP